MSAYTEYQIALLRYVDERGGSAYLTGPNGPDWTSGHAIRAARALEHYGSLTVTRNHGPTRSVHAEITEHGYFVLDIHKGMYKNFSIRAPAYKRRRQ